jgi:hypothetical protein
MSAVAVLLIGASVVGGVDVIYFHIHKCRLFSRIASHRETIAHLAQSASFVLICSWVGFGYKSRSLVVVFFLFHFASVGADILFERASRSDIGGISALEYVLHVSGFATIVAAFAVFLFVPPLAPCLRSPVLLAVALMGTSVSAVELFLLLRGSWPARLNVNDVAQVSQM